MVTGEFIHAVKTFELKTNKQTKQKQAMDILEICEDTSQDIKEYGS